MKEDKEKDKLNCTDLDSRIFRTFSTPSLSVNREKRDLEIQKLIIKKYGGINPYGEYFFIDQTNSEITLERRYVAQDNSREIMENFNSTKMKYQEYLRKTWRI